MEGSIINPFKMSRFAKQVLALMEEEGLNVAEAEAAPEYIEKYLNINSEWKQKAAPFTVYKEPTP